MAIVITDGETNPNEPHNLQDAVDAARREGIEMHAVGIHKGLNEKFDKELELISSPHPNFIHSVQTPSDLTEGD